ncbi:MAG: restriction endonuclease subunit S [Rubrivivax sp.]|nr:restriction endonuclease subunit S [Pyrinomonadaceae bacterium]
MTNNGWLESSIGDLCKFTNGRGFTPAEWSDKGLPIIRIQNLNGSTDFNYYEGETEERWVVLPDDILFAWAGTKGVSFGATIWKGSKGVLNQHIYRVHPKNGVDRMWLYYALQVVTSRIEKKAHGFKSTLLHVQKADITRQPISVPPLLEQTKIAAILLTWETAIEHNEKLIAAKDKHKYSLMQQLLTGKKRFQGFTGQEWKQVYLVDICKINDRTLSEKTHPDYEFTYLDISSVDKGKVSLSESQICFSNAPSRARRVIQKNDVIMSTVRPNLQSFAFINDEVQDLIGSTGFAVLTANESVDPRFIYHNLFSDGFTEQIKAFITGSSYPAINPSQVSALKLLLPPLEEQRCIASVLETCDQEIGLLRKQLAALKRQKRGLMQKLLTGQIRVKVAQEAAS